MKHFNKIIPRLAAVTAAVVITLMLFTALSVLGAVKREKAPEYSLRDLPLIKLPERRPEQVTRERKPPERKPEEKPAELIESPVAPPEKTIRPAPDRIRSLWEQEITPGIPGGLDLELGDLGDIPVETGSSSEDEKPAPVESDRTFNLSELDVPPRKIGGPSPDYPEFARSNDITGWVKLKLVIDKNGAVESASVLDSSPRGQFEEAAMNAARNWLFKPAMKDDSPVKCTCSVTVKFELE